jgi:hypothetical protein
MTVLSAVDRASKLMGLPAVSSLYANTNRYEVELATIANEAAAAIAKEHDWRKLTTLHTQAGDGSDTAFDLPSDFDRMPVKAAVFLTSQQQPMTPVNDLDTWMRNRLEGFTPAIGEWIILGGQLQIYPAMGASDSAKFYYQSNLIVRSEGDEGKTSFNADTDSFTLDERILSLEIIWRWRAMKGLEYAEEMRNAGIAKAQEIARDKGARDLRIGSPRFSDGASLAYPLTINAS